MRTVLPAGLLFLYATAASAGGSSDAGRALAETSCASCHAANSATAASDVAPPFSRIARDRRNDPDWVKAWLTKPHPPMEGVDLTRQQIADIVAYLRSLASD